MAQFDGLLPRFTYSTGPEVDLDFEIPPLRQRFYYKTVADVSWVPGADINSDTERVKNPLYIETYVIIKVQHITDAKLNEFYSWWNVIRDGQLFTYYPDLLVAGTNYDIKKVLKKFKPKRKDSLWYFDIVGQVY